MNPTIELLLAHRSIRKFKPDPVDDAVFAQIIGAAQAAASSSFIQACSVIRVRNPQTRAQLANIAGGQAYVADAPIFSVFCADLKRAQRCCDMHNKDMLSGFAEHFIIATVDVALMAQNAAIAAESLGLGICFIGAMRNDPQAVSALLKLPEHVYPVFGLCIGYAAQDPQVKPRLPLDVVIKEEHYSDENDSSLITEYDQTMRNYYQSRTDNQKAAGWSEQMSTLASKEARPHMLDFLRSKGFIQK